MQLKGKRGHICGRRPMAVIALERVVVSQEWGISSGNEEKWMDSRNAWKI